MKLFLIRLFFFFFFFCLLCEVIIRIFHLVPDIPERYIDQYGIQRYKSGQSGYYTKAKKKWEVNNYGWLGVSDTSKDTIVSIIGDSYIENIMNPIECNQGSILKSLLPNYSFFEAGRSGVTFIEAIEISKILDYEVEPDIQLLYLSENDFYESISEIARYNDRLQISVENMILLPNQLKNPRLKKILYSIKLLYYLYIKYPILVDKQNKGEKSTDVNVQKNINIDTEYLNKLFVFIQENYALDKLIFVFHPNTDNRIISMANQFGIKTIQLDSKEDNWGLGSHDGHWSCYGHQQVSEQVKDGLKQLFHE